MRQMSPAMMRRLINYWPPFLFSGIRVIGIADDWRQVEAELRLRWWNRNAVGTMFGGSLFAMTDPFYPLMLQHNLGREYTVWTKSAAVEFLSPGRTVARVSFRLSAEVLHEIRAATEVGKKCEPEFSGVISDPEGSLIAKVYLTLYVRKRLAAKPRQKGTPTTLGKNSGPAAVSSLLIREQKSSLAR
jgi:acyl-coenzyme A thioesterase PaaI-like protein